MGTITYTTVLCPQLPGLGTWQKYSLAQLGPYLSTEIQTQNSATLVLGLHLNIELE